MVHVKGWVILNGNLPIDMNSEALLNQIVSTIKILLQKRALIRAYLSFISVPLN